MARMIGALERVDALVVDLAGELARRSEAFDRLVMHMHGLDLFKGGVMLALVAGMWFASDPAQTARRITLLKVVLAAIVAALASRVLQNLLPIRARPMNAGDDFNPPYGLTPEAIAKMGSWATFPSDHAALFFALAAGIFVLHRPLGVLALLWTTIVICMPRIYLGLHYASDIAGGAALGIAAVLLALRLPDRVVEPACRIERRRPGPFYAAAFIFSFELAGLFWESRSTTMQLVESARLLVRD